MDIIHYVKKCLRQTISVLTHMAFSQVKHFLDNAYISQQNCLPFCLLVNYPAHRAGHQHQVPEEGAIHPRAQHGVFWQNCIKQGHVIVKHNLLFFSGGIGDGHPLGFDVTLLIK